METLSFKRHIPNILTMFRIILIIPIIIIAILDDFGSVYTISFSGAIINVSINYIIILSLFILASITDWLDGFLSRKYNWISNFGKILDPIADKVLVNTLFIILAINSNTHWAFIVLFVLRDSIVDGIRMFAASSSIVIPANIFGKLKTVTQMAAIMFLLIIPGNIYFVSDWWYWGVQNILVYLSCITSVVSGFIYVKNFIKFNKDKTIK
ncbi:MAG: CDP-diacylglycerol--glycerol-3-phosphate 3-phosphatidyltransferase [Mycoplasma sp.]